MYAFGWHPDLPDFRDWAVDAETKSPLAGLLSAIEPPPSIDLREFCSPIENQGRLGSCTAQAGVGLVELLEKKDLGKHVNGSRLFVYKTTRNLLGWEGDRGAYVRTTLKALAKFGVCPEDYWPYNVDDFDDEPTAFCYAYASTARALRYFRVDHAGKDRPSVLLTIKKLLSKQFPVIFGYPIYVFGDLDGHIRMPQEGDRLKGGHAVLAVGYDDNRDIDGYKGALLIRNSWGVGWGDKGYGWLPYGYVLDHLAQDFWTITSQDYIGD